MILFTANGKLEFHPGDVVGFHSNYGEGVPLYYEDINQPITFSACGMKNSDFSYTYSTAYNEANLIEGVTEIIKNNARQKFASALPIFILGKIVSLYSSPSPSHTVFERRN